MEMSSWWIDTILRGFKTVQKMNNVLRWNVNNRHKNTHRIAIKMMHEFQHKRQVMKMVYNLKHSHNINILETWNGIWYKKTYNICFYVFIRLLKDCVQASNLFAYEQIQTLLLPVYAHILSGVHKTRCFFQLEVGQIKCCICIAETHIEFTER